MSNTDEHLDAIPTELTNDIEAAVFRRLLEHLDANKQVQNIDLMNLAAFCRNCLSKWYVAAAEEKGVSVDYEAARERVYGMPYAQWKAQYQKEASPEQLAQFQAQQQ
ncbi:DUF1244 domain-containing protein [Congregibacter variabilis]|uniref:DUF1244 domain-containing protein n=1 Tax=Congregibacter variabilis TaxID=3081200 RepID=A0ABZ0I698_9GAMM|nr:DUF1244 domain-containing protein [Congregibacter sp. IMCC43200]